MLRGVRGIRRIADVGYLAMKKKCGGCETEKGRSFFSLGEWNKPDNVCWRRCCECKRVKKPTGGGREHWRQTMKAVFV